LVYNQVKPTDCNLEIATSNLSQRLRLQRTNDVVGPKVLFYAYDASKDKAMAGTRKRFIEFVKKHLGFSDEEIVMIDQREILLNTNEDLPAAKYYEKFSGATWQRLTAIATSIFKSYKSTGYSNQLLTIGVTECEETNSSINWFFRMI